MTLGGGQTSNGTGIGDRIHAPNSSPPEERRVRFSSLPLPHEPSTVPGTDLGNFTPETLRQRHTNDHWNSAQPAATTSKGKGKGSSPQTTTPPQRQTTPSFSSSSTTTASTTTTPKTPDHTGIPQEILDAPITHAAMLTIMADMENRFELRLRARENRLLAGRSNANNSNNSNKTPDPNNNNNNNNKNNNHGTPIPTRSKSSNDRSTVTTTPTPPQQRINAAPHPPTPPPPTALSNKPRQPSRPQAST